MEHLLASPSVAWLLSEGKGCSTHLSWTSSLLTYFCSPLSSHRASQHEHGCIFMATGRLHEVLQSCIWTSSHSLSSSAQHPHFLVGPWLSLFRFLDDRMRESGLNVKEGRFRLYIRKKFFTVRWSTHSGEWWGTGTDFPEKMWTPHP